MQSQLLHVHKHYDTEEWYVSHACYEETICETHTCRQCAPGLGHVDEKVLTPDFLKCQAHDAPKDYDITSTGKYLWA